MTKSEHEKTGPELVAEIGAEPTLDRFLDRDPHAVPYTDQELETRVKILRAERVQFELKSADRRAKRQGVEEIETTEEEKNDDDTDK